ncbi:MAG: carboxypeptidase regulatory-like domain-containing protein [Planctomycetota bacterium]
MQRSLVLAIVLLIAAAIGALWYFSGTPIAPPPTGGAGQTPVVEPVEGPAAVVEDAGRGSGVVREAVVLRSDPVLDDPEIRAGLCGFRGRVVNHVKVPVADCGVRIYRGAMDSVLPEEFDLLAEQDFDNYEPQIVAGETRTHDDGTFEITGVWPRGFYILFAGLGTDAPTHQLITRTPSPGEVVDLGDVVLNEAGVITGTVLDDEGEPLAGALVRCVDLPGALAAFFPFERVDPQGAVLVREPQAPVRVVEFPKWVERIWEHLPVPTTRSGPDGAFRLVGVVPGSNMLATTSPGFLSDVKPAVQVKAGQTRDVGNLKLRRGEELYVKVVDQKGEAVADAEVLAGSTLSMVPFDIAQRVGSTDQNGVAEGTGFSPGKVTVAARRSKRDAWVLAEPQPIIGEVTVTLPAQFAIDVTIQLADGAPAKAPRLRLLPGRAGDGAAEMFMMGMTRPIDLDDRLEVVADGRWRITGLLAGTYTVLADAPGHAMASGAVELVDLDGKVSLQLPTPKMFTVQVVDERDAPIRNAAIYAEARGSRVVEMPVRAGRTDEQGVLVIETLAADSLRVSAEHPKWGTVHGEVKVGESVTLRMQTPGSLRGLLLENGRPPEAGKFTVAVMWRRGDGPRGPLEQMPQMVTAGADGVFVVNALQPGNYWLGAVDSLEAMRSPGGVMDFAQTMFMSSRNRGNERVDVVSGLVSEVQLEVGEKPIEGPTAQLTGTVTVDGRLAAGYVLQAYGQGGRFTARVDDRGRFDFGTVPATSLWVMVQGSQEFFMPGRNSIWTSNVELKEGEVRELTIDVRTSSMEGVCLTADGNPAGKVQVSASGQLEGAGDRGGVWLHTTSDEDGLFRFPQVPAGTWSIDARGGIADEPMRGRLENLQVIGGVPTVGLRVELDAMPVVRGRVDLSSLSSKPRWSWLGFYQLKPDDPDTAEGNHTSGIGLEDDGKFSAEELTAGRYRVRLHANLGDKQETYDCGVLSVPATGLRDVVLTPRKQ